MKRWILLAVPMLLIAAVAFAQLITGGSSSSGGGSGTITGVTAGTGLNGGGSSGSVTVNLSTPISTANLPIGTGLNGTGGNINLATPVSVANGGTGVGVAANYFSWPNFMCNTTAAGTHNTNANQTYLLAINIPFAVTFSHIAVYAPVSDVSNKYDWGLYNSSGTLVADVGASAVPTSTYIYLPNTQGTVTIPPGQYFEGLTGNSNTAQLSGCTTSLWPITEYGNLQFASPTTTAGALATTITVPTFNPTNFGTQMNIQLLP